MDLGSTLKIKLQLEIELANHEVFREKEWAFAWEALGWHLDQTTGV